MKKLLYGLNLFAMIGLMVFINSCSSDDGEDVDPCLNGPKASTSNVKKSLDGEDDGIFITEVTGGTAPFMYSIDGTTFQESSIFGNLAPGNYEVTVKDANECTATTTVEIGELPIVSFADQVNPIIQTNCMVSNCHGENDEIPDWSTYESISANAGIIKTRTGEGTMPPTGPLSSTDVQLIADWVDQGAPNN